MTRRVAAILLLGALLFGGEAPALAPPPPPGGFTVTGQRDLRFQTVIAGFPTSVTWDSNEAGRWRIRGQRNSEVQLDFINLPTELQNGTFTMPISFSTTDAHWRSPGGGQGTFDPAVGVTARLGNSGQMFVYIGGTVNPPRNQAAGDYIADIDLDVFYTGN